MKPIRRRARRPVTRKKKPGRSVPQAKRKRAATAKARDVQPARPDVQVGAPRAEGQTLRSQAQLEIRFGRGERPLTAIEQAARLASAQMERRIGRLLSRRVKLTFRREAK